MLSEASRADFGYLRDALELTDGNLSRHIAVLEEAGLVKVEKGFEGKRTRTWVQATRRRPARRWTPSSRRSASPDGARRRARRTRQYGLPHCDRRGRRTLERMPLDAFTPQVREWFGRAFAAPTPAQSQAWPAIATGAHTLISAPTGSGKTLAAFLWALDRLVAEPSDRTARGSSTSRRSRRSPTTWRRTCARRCAGSAPT